MEILTRSSALLTLSDHESFGLVILEAASVGTSVIASKIPSHEEISAKLETGVTLVNTNSIEEITQAIRESLDRRDSEINENIEKFHWRKIADEYLALYGEIIK